MDVVSTKFTLERALKINKLIVRDLSALADLQTVRLWRGPRPPDAETPAAPAPRPALLKAPPVALPGYEILEELGRGGAGVCSRVARVRLRR